MLIVFLALLMLFALPLVFKTVDNTVSESYTLTTANVSTPVSQFAANITLPKSLWESSLPAVTGFGSNATQDYPSATNYNSVTKRLEISGLSDNTTRALTINYKIDSTTLDPAMLLLLPWFKWFWLLMDVGVVFGAIWAFFQA